VWAAVDRTVHLAVSTTKTFSTVKMQAQLGTDDWTLELPMTKTSQTFNGHNVYSVTFSEKYGGVDYLQFFFYDDKGSRIDSYFKAPITSWTTYGTYNNKVFDCEDDTWYSTYTINSNFSGTWQHKLILDSEEEFFLGANYEYQFIVDECYDTHYKAGDDPITSSNTSLTLSSSNSNNGKLQTTIAGTYKVSWNKSTKTISVTYPTGGTAYSVSFTAPDGWGQVNAYAWNGDKLITGIWPGFEVSATDAAGNYVCSFTSKEAPTSIIWSDNGSNQKGNFDFVNEALYTESGLTSFVLDVSDNGWATLCLPYDALIPDGVTGVHGVTGVTSNVLTMSNVANKIPNGVGVLVEAAEGSYTFYKTTGASSIGTNRLVGVTEATNLTAEQVGANNYYVLANQGGVLGFYKLAAATTILANRAYLLSDGTFAPSIIRFVEDENGATNINAVDASEEAVKFFENGKLFIKKNGVVYNMMGTIVK